MKFPTAPAWRGVIALGLVFIALAVADDGRAGADSRQLKPWTGPAPDFALADAQGAQTALAPGGASTTIVHFFATWCEPCREELPALTRLAQRAPGVRVIAISVAEPEMRVRRFLKANPTGFPVLLDGDRAVARAWGVATLPTSFVLGAALEPQLAAEESVNWDGYEPQPNAAAKQTSAQAQ
ncbi:MAG: TlpA disulfide reductase family protein [Rhodoblastus sp.]